MIWLGKLTPTQHKYSACNKSKQYSGLPNHNQCISLSKVTGMQQLYSTRTATEPEAAAKTTQRTLSLLPRSINIVFARKLNNFRGDLTIINVSALTKSLLCSSHTVRGRQRSRKQQRRRRRGRYLCSHPTSAAACSKDCRSRCIIYWPSGT